MSNIFKEFGHDFKEQIKSIKNNGIKTQIPNILTASRVIAPIFTIPPLLKNDLITAGIIIGIFALTDFFDGKIARKFNCVSEFGIKLDAVCDKFFVLGITLPAILKYKFLYITLFLELLISIVNMISESKGNKAKSSMLGKVKTTILSITLVALYVFSNQKINYLLLIITLIMQIITLINYIIIDKNKDKKSYRASNFFILPLNKE